MSHIDSAMMMRAKMASTAYTHFVELGEGMGLDECELSMICKRFLMFAKVN